MLLAAAILYVKMEGYHQFEFVVYGLWFIVLYGQILKSNSRVVYNNYLILKTYNLRLNKQQIHLHMPGNTYKWI